MKPITVSDSEWTQISGEHTLNLKGKARVMAVHIYGPSQGVDFYVDDVVVKPASSPESDPDKQDFYENDSDAYEEPTGRRMSSMKKMKIVTN